jgi:hypothetical protein
LVDPECVWGTRPDRKCPNGGAGPANLCGADYEGLKKDCVNVKMDTSNCQSKIPGSGTSTTVADSRVNRAEDKPHTEADVYKGGAPADTDGEGDYEPGDYDYTPPTGGGSSSGGSNDDEPVRPPEPEDPGTAGGNPDLVPESDNPPEELSGCATDTWTAMVNQAVMQTRREDILNKRFIVKPDSVIDYSCFMMFVDKVADDAGPVFSESKNWANIKVDILADKKIDVNRELGSKSLDGALMDIVESVSTNYIRGQFNNPPLAGTAPVDTASGSKNCSLMSKVWKAAKCKNFDGVNVFYTFEDLMTTEPREYPTNMKCDQ